MWNNIKYHLVYYLIRLAGLLPLRVLYLFSTLLYYIAFYIVGYRKKVVFDNLANSFPDKSPREIRSVAKGFYRHLCDLIVELIYQSGMTEDEINRRVRYNNFEIIQSYYDQGKHVAAVLGHCSNWEWLCGFPLKTSYKCITIYRPLKNMVFERLFLKLRSRFDAKLVPMKMSIRKIYEYNAKGKPTITAFIADQAPPLEKSLLWMDFLNQDTPVYTGMERIAKKMNMAVVYLKMKKIKRGYYEFDFIPVCDNAAGEEDFNMTKTHVSLLEQHIREQPEYWLWSHRRWKVKREPL